MRKPVWVEKNRRGAIVRIFKNQRTAVEARVGKRDHELDVQPYAVAVASIRAQVFERARGICEACGVARATEMDERLPRGSFDKEGHSGQISLDNSRALCHGCHQGPKGHHGDRLPRLNWLTLE